jgi:hypothetical protein
MTYPAEGQHNDLEPDGTRIPIAYRAATTRATPPLEEVRRTIPGWGVDLNYRPAEPMEDFDPGATGAHWHFPERQPELWPREKSPEHGMLPPVFGTVAPPRGISGAIRRYAYTLSEGRSSHWLLLMLADRVDVLESRVESVLEGHPDNVIGETGVIAELKKHPLRSRVGRHRTDLKHQWMDPLITMAPYVIGGYLALRAGRAIADAVGGDDDASWRMAARRRRAEVARDDDPVPRARMRGDTRQPTYR